MTPKEPFSQLIRKSVKFEDYLNRKRKVFSYWPESQVIYDRLFSKALNYLKERVMVENRMK